MLMPESGLVDEDVNSTLPDTDLMRFQLFGFHRLRLVPRLAGLLWLRKRNRMNEYECNAKNQAQYEKAASPNHKRILH
jgi:hypothetical protein